MPNPRVAPVRSFIEDYAVGGLTIMPGVFDGRNRNGCCNLRLACNRAGARNQVWRVILSTMTKERLVAACYFGIRGRQEERDRYQMNC